MNVLAPPSLGEGLGRGLSCRKGDKKGLSSFDRKMALKPPKEPSKEKSLKN
ncbi:MAG: hypothetical protein NTW82_02635 [Bacteroidia bacterium]|nr:hypothetical protein [Bacteroidia bacterium]